MSAYTEYEHSMVSRFWKYQEKFYPRLDEWFDAEYLNGKNPPVFLKTKATANVQLDPGLSEQEQRAVLKMVLVGEHHMWFRSMRSSQALAQSVFGNLAVGDLLGTWRGLVSDEGDALFGDAQLATASFVMEHNVSHLGEPRPTSLDGYFSGSYRVAIECKLMEDKVGPCSRPGLTPRDSKFDTDHCDGTYSLQRERKNRCALTEVGVRYWELVPQLFRWQGSVDLTPCPLHRNYQVVRNILAVATDEHGLRPLGSGHAVLIYDARNPAFQEGGKGLAAYHETQAALLDPTMLRKCSWQRLLEHLRSQAVLPGLMEQLDAKYGL